MTIIYRFFSVLAAVLLLCSNTVFAEKNVTEEILDILKESDQISPDQYDDMKKRAEREKNSDWAVYWKNGTHVESRDGKHRILFGGRMALDWAAINADEPMNAQIESAEGQTLSGNGVEFRQARLFVQGSVYKDFDFKVQYDFAGQNAAFKDVYAGLRNMPALGNVRLGHMKEPMSIERLTSGKFITFMESPLPVLAFAPGRNTGIMAFRNAFGERLYWGLGAFYDVGDAGDQFQTSSQVNVTARVTGLPWYTDGGKKLLHIGMGYSRKFRDAANDSLRFRTRPEAHITDARTVNTGNFPSDGADIFNPEAALVFGPVSLQAEYFHTTTDATAAGDPVFSGAYVFGSWFVTGESRNYKRSAAAFDRVTPKNNFSFSDAGWGAVELALRWSSLDLNDGSVAGGEEGNVTAGVNWYLTPNARLMVNYVHGAIKDRAGVADGDLNILQSRFQIDF